jgi:hypothetical protein
MRVSACAVWLGLGAFVSGNAAAAEPSLPDESGSPDIELLEYLGDLVDEHGGWVGPDDMQGVVDAKEAATVHNSDAAPAAEQVR